jgi:D-alanine-D-alanine ligase-like ATP-grasp enzyme
MATDTVSTDDPDAPAHVEGLLRTREYPLICKPRDGSASAGVAAVADEGQLTWSCPAPAWPFSRSSTLRPPRP